MKKRERLTYDSSAKDSRWFAERVHAVEPSLQRKRVSYVYARCARSTCEPIDGGHFSLTSWPDGETRWCGWRGLYTLSPSLSLPLRSIRYTYLLPRAKNFSARRSLSFFVQACSASSYTHARRHNTRRAIHLVCKYIYMYTQLEETLKLLNLCVFLLYNIYIYINKILDDEMLRILLLLLLFL